MSFMIEAGSMSVSSPRRVRVRQIFTSKDSMLGAVKALVESKAHDYYEVFVMKNGAWKSAHIQDTSK